MHMRGSWKAMWASHAHDAHVFAGRNTQQILYKTIWKKLTAMAKKGAILQPQKRPK